MCDPVTLGSVAAGVSAIGKGYSALVANAQARGAAAQDRVNMQEANRSAADAIQQGNIDQQQHYRQVSAQLGQQRAAMAANGIDIGFGSALDVTGDTAMIGSEDAATISENTVRKARGFQIQAANYESDARSQKLAGRAALVKGAFDVGSTILGGAQQYSYLKSQQNFGGGGGSYGVKGSGGIY